MDLTNLTSIVNLTAAANLTSTANLTSAINPATELNTTANLMSTTTTRVLNSKCATKLNTNSLKSSFSAASRRFSTNNAWAIKKDKIHSTINFKNQSLFKQTDLTAFEELATPQRPAFANKTLPIHLPMNVQTPLFNRAAVNATANTTANATANATAVDEVMTDAMTAHTMVAEKVIADATTVEAATADATTADATTVDATPVNATTVDATEIADAQNLEIDKSMNQTNANESVSKDAEPEKDQTVGEKSIQQNDKTVGDLQEKTVVDDQKTLVDEERTVIDDQKNHLDDQQTLVNDQQTLTDPEKTVMDDEKIVVDESNESRELMCRAKDPSMFGLEMSGNQLSIKEHLIYEKTEVTMNDSQDQSEIVQSMRVDEEQSQKNEQSMENMNEQSMENMNQQSMEIVNNQSMAKSVQNLSVAKSVQNESVVRPAFSADQTANKSLNRSAAIRPNVSQSMKSVHESPYKLANLSQQRTLPAANKTLERTLLEKSAPEIRVTNTELMDEPMEITRTADDSRQQQLLNNSRDIVLDEQGSAYATVNSNQTIDEMLNAIKVNISNRLKEHSRLTSNASQLGAFLEATNPEFLDEKSSSLNDFKLSQSIDRNSQSSSPTSFTPNSSAKINSIVQKLNSMEKPANSTFVQTKRAEETSNLSVCIGNRSNLVQSEMEVQETQEVQEIQKVQEREKEASVQQNKQEAVSVQELEKEASIQLHDKEALIQDPIQASIQDSIQASVQASVRQQEVSVQEREQELSARAGPSRRLSLFQNLSNLERELNRDTMNDSVLAFQTQTEFERTPSTTATEHFDANNYEMGVRRRAAADGEHETTRSTSSRSSAGWSSS
ncbi:hypothetical protein L1887_57619 [Cichorium endivia]|nr:hypothetical protein L1887_57619 [Cichorium endivia]